MLRVLQYDVTWGDRGSTGSSDYESQVKGVPWYDISVYRRLSIAEKPDNRSPSCPVAYASNVDFFEFRIMKTLEVYASNVKSHG